MMIQVYGVCIAVGIVLVLFLAMRNQGAYKRAGFRTSFEIIDLAQVVILAAVFGGRLLTFVVDAEDRSLKSFLSFWLGGFSIIGAVLGALVAIFVWTRYTNKALLPVFDFCALYAPLLHAFGRFGCFMAGCCEGVVYGMPLQLVVVLLYGMVFYIFQRDTKLIGSGIHISAYIAFLSAERFMFDSFRLDRVLLWQGWSFYELISIVMFIASCCYGVLLAKNNKK